MTRHKTKALTEQEKALNAKYERLRELREQLETKASNALKGSFDSGEQREAVTILDASKDAALIKARLGNEALSLSSSSSSLSSSLRDRPIDDSDQPPSKRPKVEAESSSALLQPSEETLMRKGDTYYAATIYVGRIHPGVAKLHLQQAFQVFGPIHSIRLTQQKNCAFVRFYEPASASKAISQMDGSNVFGAPIKVDLAKLVGTGGGGGGGGSGGMGGSRSFLRSSMDRGPYQQQPYSPYHQSYGDSSSPSHSPYHSSHYSYPSDQQ